MKSNEWVATVFMSFLITGFIWGFYELIDSKAGWWASFLFLYLIVFGVTFGVSRMSRDENEAT